MGVLRGGLGRAGSEGERGRGPRPLLNFDARTLVRDVINDVVEESSGKGKSCNRRAIAHPQNIRLHSEEWRDIFHGL